MADTGIATARVRAASLAQPGSSGGKCPDCVKSGLAILPVVYTALPNRIRPAAGLDFLPESDLAKAFRNLDKGLNSEDMQHHWHVLRALPSGYLYILDPADGTWQSFAVDTDGQLHRMGAATLPAAPESPAPCSRSEHNDSALQTFVLDPEQTPEVWIAFSRFRWTDRVMQNYAADKDGCRAARMSKLNVAYAASKGPFGSGSPLPNGMRMVSTIRDYVADYAPDFVRDEINKHLIEPLHHRGPRHDPPLIEPSNPGQALAAEMQRMCVGLDNTNGIVLLLDDIVGVTAQLNHSRNRIAADAAIVAGMGDPERSRRRVVADVIEGLRASAEANPGPWWNRNFGPDRYLRHIDQAAWQQALAESDQFKSLLASAENVSADYVEVKESIRWKAVQRLDFDPDDHASVRDHEHMVAWCTAGSGLCRLERERVWEAVLELADTDADNWLSRALAAQDEGVLDLMHNAPPGFGQTLDGVKNAKALSAELLVGQDGKMGAIETINRFRLQIRADRAANAATSTLIESASNVMAHLLQSNPARYHRLLRKITITGLVRDDLVPQPVVVRGTWARISEWIMEIMTGPVRVDAQAAVTVGPMLSGPDYMRTRGRFSAGWSLSQSVNGAVLYSPPATQAETASVVFWVVNKVEAGTTFDAAALRAFGLNQIDTTIPSRVVPDNPALRNHLNRMSLRADGMFSSVALLFQAHMFYGALTGFRQGKGDLGDGTRLLSAVLAGSAAGLELYAAAQGLRGAHTLAQRVTVMRFAAQLGMWAGIVDGVYSLYQGREKYKRGNKDSAYWSLGCGIATIAGSIAGIGFASAGLAAMGGGTATATVLGITLGPVGWLLLAVALLGVAIYCAIQAFGTDDSKLTPLEYWLDNGVFGKRVRIAGAHLEESPFVDRAGTAVQPFTDVNDELYQLQRITLVAQAQFGSSRSARAGAEIAMYEIALPRYDQGTALSVTLFGYTEDRRVVLSEFTCQNGEAKPARFRSHVRLSGGDGSPTLEIDAETGTMRLSGRLGSGGSMGVGLLNFFERLLGGKQEERYVDIRNYGMELVYKPDIHQLPTLETVLRYPLTRR